MTMRATEQKQQSQSTSPEQAPSPSATQSHQAQSLPAWIQRQSLTVNAPDDVYEQEARAIADQVMRMPAQGVQRRCACGGVAGADGECAACKAKRLQRQADGGGQATGQAPPSVNQTLSQAGQPLDGGTRSFMESRFGHNFEDVRVHTNTQAAQSAAEVKAAAYTVGRDVVFGAGQYQPQTSEGKRLIAHELVHTVQQGENTNEVVQRQSIHDPSYPCQDTSLLAGGTAFRGTWIHILIQQFYVSLIDPQAAAEYTIPGSSLSGSNGRADIVDSSGGIYEIKPFSLTGQAFREAMNYMAFAELNCSPHVNWHLGTRYFFQSFYLRGEIVTSWLVAPGVIAYLRTRPPRQPQPHTQPRTHPQTRPHPHTIPAPVEDEDFLDKMSKITGLTGAALIAYIIVSEGSRLFPPRNLIPVP